MKHLRPILTVIVLLVVLFLVVSISGNYVEAPIVDAPATTNPTTTTPITGTLSPVTPGAGSMPPAIPGNKTVTYRFEATLPTPCHRLSEPDVLIAESFPGQVSVRYDVVPPTQGTMCTQVITTIEVTDSVGMPASAILSSVSVNGTRVAFAVIR